MKIEDKLNLIKVLIEDIEQELKDQKSSQMNVPINRPFLFENPRLDFGPTCGSVDTPVGSAAIAGNITLPIGSVQTSIIGDV